MPRGTLFSDLVDMFREQAGYAVARSQGQNELPGIKAALRRTYRRLHADFEWPHLQIYRDEILQSGERFYTFPHDLDFDSITEVWLMQSEEVTQYWYRMQYGIGRGEHNSIFSGMGNGYDPAPDAGSVRDPSAVKAELYDPPYRWQIHENNQYEVWPVPQADSHTMRFFGRSKPRRLLSDSDPVDLDDDMIVLYTLAERLARDKSPDADLIGQQARQHYMRVRGNSQKTEPIDSRVNYDRYDPSPGIDIAFVEGRRRHR